MENHVLLKIDYQISQVCQVKTQPYFLFNSNCSGFVLRKQLVRLVT